jgi:hypothetical protein
MKTEKLILRASVCNFGAAWDFGVGVCTVTQEPVQFFTR